MLKMRSLGRHRIGKVESKPTVHRSGRRLGGRRGSIRKRSAAKLFGLPLWEISKGPDPEHGERRGHARAIFAVGDVADGVIALGGISRGVIAIGGISMGIFTLGGIAIGLATAVGGVAAAPFAMGGVAFGIATVGGVAVGPQSWRLPSSRAVRGAVLRRKLRHHQHGT